MGNQNNVNLTSVKKENLINTKSVTNRVKTSNNINFFLDMLAFPEEEKLLVSASQNLMIFESITFKLIQTLEIKDLKVLQKINNSKNGIDRTYSFFASKGGSWACIYLIRINFNDYTIYTKEIIRKHMPKYYFLNFFELSTNMIVIAFNKGTIMIFDEPKNLLENEDENLIDDDDNIINNETNNNVNNNINNNNDINNINNINNNSNNDNNNDNNSKNGPIEKEKQLFKFKNEVVMNEQQESCGFFEVSDTCFIGITSIQKTVLFY